MNLYGELDLVPEHIIEFHFKGKQKHIAIVGILNIACWNQHADNKIPVDSKTISLY